MEPEADDANLRAEALSGVPWTYDAVAGVVAICITNRAAEVRARAQAAFGFYEGAMPYRRMLEVGDAKRIGDVCVIGDEEAVARRLRQYADAGMTDFLAAPLADGESTWAFTAERLARIRL